MKKMKKIVLGSMIALVIFQSCVVTFPIKGMDNSASFSQNNSFRTPSAVRSMQGAVLPSTSFNATIVALNYGMFGQVVETLPVGFTYISSSLPPGNIEIEGSDVKFTIFGETTFNYTVESSSTPGTYTFVGILKDSLQNEYPVTGDSEIIVGTQNPPEFGAPSPANGSINQPVNLLWSILISDPEGDTFSWTIQCSNGQQTSGSDASNGTKSLTISGLAYLTNYTVWVNATDPGGSGEYTKKWYVFTTKNNQPPAFGQPIPDNESPNQPLSLTWKIPINDPEADTFSWSIQCSNGQTNSSTGATNGTKSLLLSDLAPEITYKIWVNATDPSGSGLYTKRWYIFTTENNLPPIFGDPTPANNSENQSLSFTWSIAINDPEGDSFDWMIQCSSGNTSHGDGETNGTKSLSLSGLEPSRTYTIWVNATDPLGSRLYTRRSFHFTTSGNQAPNTPVITGSSSGYINIEYSFDFITTDPDNDQVFYYIEWGDGTNSGWLGPYPSGQKITQKHTWTVQGSYTLKAKAKDEHNAESGWGSLQISMPLSFELLHLRFFDWLFERFPHAFPILRQLLGY